MRSIASSFFRLALGITLLVMMSGRVFPALAAENTVSEGLTTVGTTTGLSATDPRIIIGNIINVALGFVGIVLVIMVLYAGFIWMTAGGDGKRVEKARRILTNAIIGIVIVLLSLAITTFVMNAIIGAIGGGGGGPGGGGGGPGPGLGGGSSANFTITSFRPDGESNIRNIVVQVTFNKNVHATTVDGHFTVRNQTTGDVVAGTAIVNGNRISFTPEALCPEPNADRHCFEANTQYNVSVTTDVLSDASSGGLKLSCTTAHPCTGLFTSGDIVDSENPDVAMTLPDDGAHVSVNAFVDVAAMATDNVALSVIDFTAAGVLFDSVPTSGAMSTEPPLTSVWDSAGVTPNSRLTLGAVAYDEAGNTDTGTVQVVAVAEHCLNGVQDSAQGETGVDCGGDAASQDYCGACTGTICTVNAECSSGYCVSGVCAEPLVIDAVAPGDGAPGTVVTLYGDHFGTAPGTVYFSAATGTVAAAISSCSGGWTDRYIIVSVPEGAVDGPITVVSADGALSDTTNNAVGSVIADFDVNEVHHPVLCSLSSVSGAIGDALTLSGDDFGTIQDEVYFGGRQAGSYLSWGDTAIGVTVPNSNSGKHSVYVRVGGVESNALPYTIVSDTSALPTIVSVSPSSGGIGQYVTITGSGFGDAVGAVWFYDAVSGQRALGDTVFPEQCATSYWSNTTIVVKVPEDFTGGDRLTPGNYSLEIETHAHVAGARVSFVVTDEPPAPGLCVVSPSQGEPGDTVTFFGDDFGAYPGTVTFSGAAAVSPESWSDSSTGIVVVVPERTQTGDVFVTSSAGRESNRLPFVSGESSIPGGGEGDSGLASYVWTFSTGSIPDVPEVIVACDSTTISAVPNDAFTDAVCVNAVVHVEFTADMNQATLPGAIVVERCTETGPGSCVVASRVTGRTTSTTSRSMSFRPTNATGSLVAFDPSTRYRITITTDAQSADGAALARDVSWTFTTKNDTSPCVLDRVLVRPATATLTESMQIQEFSATPVSQCVPLFAQEYTWDWSIDSSVARFNQTNNPDCTAGVTSCAAAQAVAEGVTTVTAREDRSDVSGSGTLTVNFSDPYVTQYWPNCDTACTNAMIRADFAAAMNEASLLAAGAVDLYRCDNELCASTSRVADVVLACAYDDLGNCMGVTLTPSAGLSAGAFYQVRISGDVESVSGVPLTRVNDGGDFAWTFRTREDGTACAVERVSVSPDGHVADGVGERALFSAQAWGGADDCSVSGQELQASRYAWSWDNPIADDNYDDDETTRVASWYGDAVIDTDLSSVSSACTSSCLSAGSSAYAAICGDGVLNVTAGEECEDGNVFSGDGCSESCLREGALFDASGNRVSLCGNRLVERSGDGAGEDCDDGNINNNDGCSSNCLAEGSNAIGATCGNNDIGDYLDTLAGEECDDGNARSGDGCSSQCVHEGSPTLASVGNAVCGNGVREVPAENCDDGNTDNFDGCSENCLLEGSAGRGTSICGNGSIDHGEECDDTNAVGGDGCSSRCLLEGSSPTAMIPSFCGDGIAGTGENAQCELGVGGDGRVDPAQSAIINDEAVFEISSETQQARATIVAQEDSSGFADDVSWLLACSATSDADCRHPDAQGVGAGHCCIDRPTVNLFPTASSSVCRNSELYGIFSQEMQVPSFSYTTDDGETSYRMYAQLDMSTTGGVCPDGHVRLAQFTHAHPIAQLWRRVMDFFAVPVDAAAGDCVVPITGYTQTALEDGTYKVSMHTSRLLESGGRYTLIVEGDTEVTDDVASGVVSRFGVGMNGFYSTEFTASDTICSLDAVVVADGDDNSPYVFSQIHEEHIYTATAVTYVDGVAQSIASFPGVYSWTWSNWVSDAENVVSVVPNETSAETGTVTAVGENGGANVVATATVLDERSTPSLTGNISGYAPATALLCEHPWPSIGSETYPWSDDDSGATGAIEGAGWMHFSFAYCRDAGSDGVEDDLPSLRTVYSDQTKTANVIKEYLFPVQNTSGDAIGVRVVSNPDYLSPLAWYAAQGFHGDPTQTTIDGFAAVRDGRTVYIAAPNLSDAGEVIYSNIYVFTYNEGASSETENIFQQILETVTVGTNISDISLCTDGLSYGEACSADRDCAADPVHPVCANVHDKIQRDMRRLTDANDIVAAIDAYGAQNGSCSATTSRLCSSSSDCPSGETCTPLVPQLPSGTFVRNLVSSSWGSWSDLLGGAVGTDLPSDPLNAYSSCGVDPYAQYDANTCVNSALGTYICPENSYVYHYRSSGARAATVTVDLEYPLYDWNWPIDDDAADSFVSVRAGASSGFADGFETTAFCDGTTVYGGSTVCGDGVIGSSEVCEQGQLGGEVVACDTDLDDGVDTLDGTRSQVCNTTCSGFVDNTAASCIPATCGNAQVESGEACDDGGNNGRYGYCSATCQYSDAAYCGDGTLAGGEVCDCGNTVLGSPLSDSRAFGGNIGACSVVNGVYTASPASGCAWDCSGAPPSCGDGVVQYGSGEQCDGADATYSGALCSFGDSDMLGMPCDEDVDCGSSGICGGSTYFADCAPGQQRVRTCDDDIGGTCDYLLASSGYPYSECMAIGSCGDGVVDADEECDDGNSDSSDFCTSSCTLNTCGDGSVYVGVEECDDGSQNGETCSALYGSTCSSCSVSCRYEVSSGAFCGDGVINGAEYCDGSDIPYKWFDDALGIYSAENCTAAQVDTARDFDGVTYHCRRVGVCNGGSVNGAYCTANVSFTSSEDTYVCGANSSCTYPTCSSSCVSSCPFADSVASLTMVTNQPGADVDSMAEVYTYDDDSTAILPNAITLQVPSCSAVSSFSAVIDTSEADLSDLYIIFAVDNSYNLEEPARTALKNAISSVFSSYGSRAHVTLEGYSRRAGTGLCSDTGRDCASDTDCGGTATCDNILGFLQQDEEATLLSRIDSYEVGSSVQGINDAFYEAEALFDAISDDQARKIMVLFASVDSDFVSDTDTQSDALKRQAEVYTIASSSDVEMLSNMLAWSSNGGEEYHAETGIDYAYDVAREAEVDELDAIFQTIVGSFDAVTVSFVSSSGDYVSTTTGAVVPNVRTTLPFPERFSCDPANAQELPMRIYFRGSGVARVSDVQMNACR